jgi:hypothetical protein
MRAVSRGVIARVLVVLLALALAPAARADVFIAAGDSPQIDLPPSQDIRHVDSMYTVALRLPQSVALGGP